MLTFLNTPVSRGREVMGSIPVEVSLQPWSFQAKKKNKQLL